MPSVKAGTEGGLAETSSDECRRTIRRLPAASQVWLKGLTRSRTTRVTGGAFWYWLRRSRIISPDAASTRALLPDNNAFGNSAFNRSMTSRAGLFKLLMTGTNGLLDRISTAGPADPSTTFTLRITIGGSVVANSFGVDCAWPEASSAPASNSANTKLRTRGWDFIA